MLDFPNFPYPGQTFYFWTWDGQKWVQSASSGFAPLNSPNFTGVPTAPTAAPGTSTAQLATTAFVMQAITSHIAGVASFNNRTGNVTFELSDVTGVGGAPINSPAFTGNPTTTNPPPGDNSNRIATTEWVQQRIATVVANSVTSFNGRHGAVFLTLQDILLAGGAPLVSPFLLGIPEAPTALPGSNSFQIANTAFVTHAVGAAVAQLEAQPEVTSFNGRTGNVQFLANDISAVGGAMLWSPVFQGNPQAPTPPPGDNNGSIATTAFVQAAINAQLPEQGPPGPIGPPGAPGQGFRILGSVASAAALPPSGQIGDVWIAQDTGIGYVWRVTPAIQGWAAVGNMVGLTGPAGPPGLTGPAGPQGPGLLAKGMVPTVADLPVSGMQNGDLWVAADTGNGYVWENGQWVNLGQMRGPQGPGALHSFGPAPPTNPDVGDFWTNTTDGSFWSWNGTTWVEVAAGGGGGGTLGPIANNTVLGNTSGATATPTALTQTQLTTLINTFTSTLSGAVPASGGGTTNYLRADGTWAAVPGLASIGNNTVLGNISGSSAQPSALTQAQLTALVNQFAGSSPGTVPTSSGGTTNFLRADGTWAPPTAGGGGSVTSVAATVPTGLAVAGSPITTAGTLAISWSGTIPNAQVPAPTASALGGVMSASAPANQFATGITTAGALTFGQPAFANLSGTLALSQMPAMANNTVLGNVSGSSAAPAALTQAQLTALINQFTATTAGDVPASGGGTANFLRADGTWVPPPGGLGTVTSVAATVPTGLAISGSPITTSGTLAVTWSGTIPNAQVPAPTASALGGVISSTAPANQFATGITTAGAVTYAQPSFGNLSGSVAATQMPALTGAVTTTAGSTVTTLSAGAVGVSNIATAAIATIAQIQSNTANLFLQTDETWGAVSPVTFATTGAVTLNLSNGIDWQPASALTGNVTISFSNPKPGQAGVISVVAGSFTVAWGGSVVLPSSGAPAANTTGPTDYWYWCDRSGVVHVNKAL